MKSENDYIEVINSIISRRRKDLPIIKSSDDFSNAEYLETVIDDVLLDEFIEFGLKDDSEPNEYGFEVDKLITYLNRIRYKNTGIHRQG